MTNLIKADIYRILRGKAFYVTLGLVILFSAINIVAGTIVIGVNTEAAEAFASSFEYFDGVAAASFLMTSGDSTLYFAVAMFITTSMDMFTFGAVKNDISSGMPRNKLYYSKWILSSVICVLILLAYLGAGIALAAVLHGAGDWSGAVLPNFFKAAGGQLLLLLALNSVGIFFCFLMRNSTAAACSYIAFTVLPGMVFSIIALINPRFDWLRGYDLRAMMTSFAYIGEMASADIIRNVIVGAVVLAASAFAGMAVFKRAEIK